MDDLLADFLAETNESLAEADLALVRLERNPDDQPTLALVFRLLHTIKGTCGFLGLPRLERLAHAGENVLARVRDGELAPDAAVVSVVLAALDGIKAILAGLAAAGAEPAGDDASLIDALNLAASGVRPAPPPMDAAPAIEAPPLQAAPLQAAPLQASPLQSTPVQAQTLRVNVDLLEQLMTLVGELVLTRNQLVQASRAAGTSAISAPLQHLSQIVSELQDTVTRTRMQPIGHAWNKLPRLIRDLAQSTGKKIELEMNGQDTEIDRQVLEMIRDPLTHMVRNCADHGLEDPAARRQVGKAETGRIRLTARHEGAQVRIEIADDGRGMNLGRIRARALSQRLATEAELAEMGQQQLLGFIFRPGFSTAETVSALSGRGVGMDVVRSNIERIGGTVELASTEGQGMCCTIKIPLTVAIVPAAIVEAAGERFAVPQGCVLEMVRAGSTQAEPDGAITIDRIGGRPVLRLRERLVPLLHLGALLGLQPAPDASAAAAGSGERETVLVTQSSTGVFGIVVDHVLDTEEIVVKPVAAILRHLTLFSGNTILGDGSVILILDPNGIARSAGVSAPLDRQAAREAGPRASHSADEISLLLFRAAGEASLRAVPLSLVGRLESLAAGAIERCASGFVTHYRGALMKLIPICDRPPSDTPQPVLVFADGERRMGLMVDEIVDIVRGSLKMELAAASPGWLGTAVVAGTACDVLDTGYWLTHARHDWFSGAAGPATRKRLLVVEDSDFFREMLVPTLAAAGYEVTAAGGPAEALALRDAGLMVDAILSDIDMPDMDGLSFARTVRQGGPGVGDAWARLPMIALTGGNTAKDVEAGRSAGFTDYLAKSARGALLESLGRCLAASPTGGATE